MRCLEVGESETLTAEDSRLNDANKRPLEAGKRL